MDHNNRDLADLEETLVKEFSYLNYPVENWVKPVNTEDGQAVLDVAIIGAGACGLATWYGLMREGITNIEIVDRGGDGMEGPWITTARMQTLRSPKHLTGPNMGLPNLTFRAWFEACFGCNEWEILDKIPRQLWMAYLVWYRKILNIPVKNKTALRLIESEADWLRLTFVEDGTEKIIRARHLVLATGRSAFGGVRLPDIARKFPKFSYAHTEEDIDFHELRGKKVIVIGGAASAVDSAATALEAGAANVSILMRAPTMPRLNKFKNISYPGFMRGFTRLDKLTRWRFLKHGFDSRIAAPRSSMLRLKEHPNFDLHLGTEMRDVKRTGDTLLLQTNRGSFDADFVIFGTGYAVNIERQPELAPFAHQVKLWRDCFTPPIGEEDETLGSYPYLGTGFEFLEKAGVDAPHLKRLHLFNAAATMTHAPISSDIPGVNTGVSRLVDHLAKSLFVEGAGHHLQDFYDYCEPELLGDEWDQDDNR